MENEIWKDIPEYEGLYQVSNLGNIKSLEKIIYRKRNGNYINKELIMSPPLSNKGYPIVTLTKNKKTKTFKVHSIMAIAFLNYKNGIKNMVIDHIDNNKLNNNICNLQIITFRENVSKDRKNKSSKYTGVNWHKRTNKWQSEITINYKKIYLGIFNNEIDAHNAYQDKLKSINE